MNIEETSEQRLKQIEILLATAAKTINRTDERLDRLTERQDHTAEAIDRLTERQDLTFMAIDRLTERQDRSDERMDRLTIRMGEISEFFVETVKIIREQQISFDRMQANIDKMSSEIRGLQVENQRILLRVFGGDEYLDH